MSYTSVQGRIPVVFKCGCIKFMHSPGVADPVGYYESTYDGENPVSEPGNCWYCNQIIVLTKKIGDLDGQSN